MSKPESETDPWKGVKATYADIAVNKTARVYLADVVESARAAEAAQHRQEMKRQIDDFDGLCGTIQSLRASLAAVEAERDKAQRALATAYLKARRQASVCEPNEDQFAGAMAVVAAAFPNTRVEATAVRIAKPEEPTELVVAVKRRAERAEAERDRLKAALQPFAAHVHQDGVDAPYPEEHWKPLLIAARAALTPQGQSTDGETR